MLDAFKSPEIDLQNNDILEAIRSLAASENIHFHSKRGAECGLLAHLLRLTRFATFENPWILPDKALL